MYNDRCDVTNIETGNVVEADILDFKEGNVCVVSIQKQIKLVMKYNNQKNNYVGRKGGLEFTTFGPKVL